MMISAVSAYSAIQGCCAHCSSLTRLVPLAPPYVFQELQFQYWEVSGGGLMWRIFFGFPWTLISKFSLSRSAAWR